MFPLPKTKQWVPWHLGIILESHQILRMREMFRLSVLKGCTRCDILQLLGHLNFASHEPIPGRSFKSHLLRLASLICELLYHVHLNAECYENIQKCFLRTVVWSFLLLRHWSCQQHTIIYRQMARKFAKRNGKRYENYTLLWLLHFYAVTFGPRAHLFYCNTTPRW